MSSWWTSSRVVYGTELRAGALCLVDHGWAVVPGNWWQEDGWQGNSDGNSTSVSGPAVPGGVAKASTNPAQVARWWAQAPYAVLLATGGALDAIEMPAWMGRRVASTLRSIGVVAPLAATPTGRWWFPVATGGPALAQRSVESDVTLHGVGSWVIAPPSECADGLAHWRVHPGVCGWRLPEAQVVHSAVAEAVRWRANPVTDESFYPGTGPLATHRVG